MGDSGDPEMQMQQRLRLELPIRWPLSRPLTPQLTPRASPQPTPQLTPRTSNTPQHTPRQNSPPSMEERLKCIEQVLRDTSLAELQERVNNMAGFVGDSAAKHTIALGTIGELQKELEARTHERCFDKLGNHCYGQLKLWMPSSHSCRSSLDLRF